MRRNKTGLAKLIRWFGGTFVTAHAQARRVDQRQRFAVFFVRMILDVLITQEPGAGFFAFVEAFQAQPGSGLVTFLAGHLRLDVTSHQSNGVLGGRLALARTNHSDVVLRGSAEVI
jgi:hypothetical protein